MDQLTMILQLLAPTAIVHVAGTVKESSDGDGGGGGGGGGFGIQRVPLQVLSLLQTALDGLVPSAVDPSESSKIFRPKSSVAVSPGWDAKFEISVPSCFNDGSAEWSIAQLTTIVQVAAPSGIVQPTGTMNDLSTGGGGGIQHISASLLQAAGDETSLP